MSEIHFTFKPNPPPKIHKKVGRPKGSSRNAFKTIPKRTVETKAIALKAYSWIYDTIEPYLEVWFFSLSEFLRSAIRDAMLYASDEEISYFIHKGREQRKEKKESKKITWDKDEPLCFKLSKPAKDQVDEKCNYLRIFNKGKGLGNITRTDYIKAAVLWYDEEYLKPKDSNTSIGLKKNAS